VDRLRCLERRRRRETLHLIREKYGRLDYAFNNVGSGGRAAPVASTTEDAWRKTIDGFLTSVFLCMRYQTPLMLDGGGGVIVSDSSVDGLRGYPFPGGAAYSAAKHGVLGLTKSAALEHAPSGLRITAICPGWVETPAIANWMRREDAAAAKIVSQTPRGRIADPGEIANAVLWLCSGAASFMIGSPVGIWPELCPWSRLWLGARRRVSTSQTEPPAVRGGSIPAVRRFVLLDFEQLKVDADRANPLSSEQDAIESNDVNLAAQPARPNV
jgi:NADP-dependent 3-hydroxy acid dehydrogenase YdfG